MLSRVVIAVLIAVIVGLADKIGQITPGYLADIILIDLSGAHHQPRTSSAEVRSAW